MPRAKQDPTVTPGVPGVPGVNNRSDLPTQPIATLKGGTFGSAQTSRDAQRAVPLAAVPTPTDGGPPRPRASLPPLPLTAPTQRPNEPLTAVPDPEPDVDEDLREWVPVLRELASYPNASLDLRELAARAAARFGA